MGARQSKGRQATTASSTPPWTGLPPDLAGESSSKGNATSAGSSAPWTGLQPELADLLLRYLTSHADRVRFAAVCRHWRYVAREYSPPSLPPALPWINFREGAFESLPNSERHFFVFWEQAVCSGSFGNWLLFEEAGCRLGRHHYLRNPLSGDTHRLPVLYDNPTSLNPYGSHGMSSNWRCSEFYISKVIVCSNDLIAAIVRYMHHTQMRSVVVCCRPGMSSWLKGLYNGHWYMDMAFYKGKLYAVTVEGHLFAHDVSKNSCITKPKPRVYQIEQAIPAPSPLDGFFTTSYSAVSCYLVISHTGKLLMVRWIVPSHNNEVQLKVFEADLEMSQWLEVKSLDDQVLFVSPKCSKAIGASGHGDYMQGNKIYFVHYSLTSWLFEPITNKCACVYDMTCNKFHPISLCEDVSHEWNAAWFFP